MLSRGLGLGLVFYGSSSRSSWLWRQPPLMTRPTAQWWVTWASDRKVLNVCLIRSACNGGEHRLGDAADYVSPPLDALAWTRRISHHIKCGQHTQALKAFRQMRSCGVGPSSSSFIAALKACRGLQDLESAKQIHVEVGNSIFHSDVYVGTMLIDVYVKCGSLGDARSVFDKMHNRDVTAWNAMISGYAQLQQGEEALQLFARMQQQDRLEPNARTFVCALKACSSLLGERMGDAASSAAACHQAARKKLCLEQVRAIHSHVLTAAHSELDLFVGNMLVDVYAKCGSLAEARLVFETMRCRDVVSWNALILGYVQMEAGETALHLFTRMQQEGVVPDDRTFVAALKACCCSMAASESDKEDGTEDCKVVMKGWCLEQAKCIHLQVINSGSEASTFVATMLVDVYAKCGNLVDARHVFEKIPHRDVVCWNAMILGYSQMEQGEEALRLFARMQQEGVVPDDRTFVAALKACSSLTTTEEWSDDTGGTPRVKRRCLQHVKAMHSEIVNCCRGSQMGMFVGNMLVDVYARCGSLANARYVFDNMRCRDVISWNAMILGYAQMEEGEEALLLYTWMQQDGVHPDDRTFVSALKACSVLAVSAEEATTTSSVDGGNSVKERCLKQIKRIHSQAVGGGFASSLCVSTMLVDVYVKCGQLTDAECVFAKMPRRDVVSWTAMILGHVQLKGGEEALALYAQMKEEDVVPDDQTFVAALRACSSLAAVEEGCNVDGKCVMKTGCLEQVRAIHCDIDKRGEFASAAFVGTALLDVYAKCGSLVEARLVFAKMPHRDVVSWNAMIAAYAEANEGEKALQLCAQMQQEGVVPDDRTFVAMLNACGSVAGLEKGKEIHAHICNAGLSVSDPFIASSLIDMYGKCASMVDAQEVFDALICARDAVTWNALLVGYARHGDSSAVFDLFERMRQDGVEPNSITFLALLTVCSHAGLVDKGWNYFKAMSRDSSVEPNVQHYTCMVDLLGRAGQLNRAMEVVDIMPFETPGEVWRSLLGSCRKWGSLEVGKQAFKSAVGLDKNDAAAYVLMSNIYAAAQMQEQAKETRLKRVKAGAWKPAGQSMWADSSGLVHSFLAGDQEHPEKKEIYKKVADLLTEMKKQGYSPHFQSVLRDLPDAEKEASLCGHSERLAIAYALLKTPAGTTIRVVKNLRVCEDCHIAIGFISKIEQRTIICRDASRFHVYKMGRCSCGDFW